jgi:hypothetical protein
VPAGGTAGQFLTKIDGTNYNTDWTTLNVSGKRDLTDYDFTNVTDGFLLSYGINLEKLSGASATYTSYIDADEMRLEVDNSQGGTQEGWLYRFFMAPSGMSQLSQLWSDVGGTIVGDAGPSISIDNSGIKFGDLSSTPVAGTNRYLRTSIVFGDTTTQTTAFPGFNDAALTGNPTAPTPAFGDNDTSIATTAFVQAGLLGGTANARNLEVYVRNQSGSTIPAGSIVYISGATGNRPLITLAQANNDANSAQTIGFVKTSIANNAFGYVIVRGELENIDTSALTEGVQLYLSPTTAGTWTTTKPSAPQHLVYVGIVVRSHPTLGVILVAVQNGYELDELHDVAIGTLANNDLLAYESSTDLWKNKTFSALGLATESWVTSQGYLTSATAASTYAPIASPTFTGTVTIPAGASISGFAPLASPTFSGTPSLPTGTTAVTQSPGNNTTAVATTAFVQQEVPDFATTAQIIAGTSTTTTISPGNAGFQLTDPRLRSLAAMNSTAVSGSGAVAGNSGFVFARQMLLNSLAVGRARYGFGINGTAGIGGSTANREQINFSNKVYMSGYANMGASGTTNYLGDANTMSRITLGGYSTDTTGDMTQKGIGLKKVGGVGSFVTLTVHNGTTLTDVATTVTVPDNGGINWVIYSDGTGNVTLYINGTQAATTNAGPTGTTTNFFSAYREQVEATATPGVRQLMNCNGGWLYFE